MSTDGFHRHARLRVDTELSRVYRSATGRFLLARIVAAVRSRSELLRRSDGATAVVALANLAAAGAPFVREPEHWPGAHGHPLCTIASLAQHLYARYPVPRLLARAWFTPDVGDTSVTEPEYASGHAWRARYLGFGAGRALRTLDLPLPVTRRMEHLLLRTPEHIALDPALRRAEVLGLGGSPELAAEIVASPLGTRFERAERWREVIIWLATRSDLQLAQVRPMIDYVTDHLDTVRLAGRPFAAVARDMVAWHVALARQRAGQLAWPRSRWQPFAVIEEPTRRRPERHEWVVVELTSWRELVHEGREMHHCVARYARACSWRRSSIWSLRRRVRDDVESILTIEVCPGSGVIAQVRGPRNETPQPDGWPLEVVRRWATREQLRFR